MTRKISLMFSFITCIYLFVLPLKAQNAADIGLENTLEELITTPNEQISNTEEDKVISQVNLASQEVQAIVSSKTAEPVSSKVSKKQAKLEKFLNSKFGQWIVKRATIKAHKKEVRKQLKTFEGDKAAKKAYKEELQKEVLKTKAMNSNVRTGIILIAVGIILTILPVDILRIVGSIVIVVGLVFLILGLI